jgi:hypothetical protein
MTKRPIAVGLPIPARREWLTIVRTLPVIVILVSRRQKPDLLLVVLVIVWSIAVLLGVIVGSAVVLAETAGDEGPNWSEITLAISTAFLALATVGLAVAAGIALLGIKESIGARNALTTMEMSRRWDEKVFREVRRKIRNFADSKSQDPGSIRQEPEVFRDKMMALHAGNDVIYRELLQEPDYLEDLALLIKYEGIDFRIVNDSLGYIVAYRWSLWELTAVWLRQLRGEPLVYKQFEKLAYRIAEANPKSVTTDENGRIKWQGFRE